MKVTADLSTLPENKITDPNIVQEYISECEALLDKLSYNGAFDNSYLVNLLHTLKKKEAITDKQIRAILNIREKWTGNNYYDY